MPKSPWGAAKPPAPSCSLSDVMSEELARQLDEEYNAFPTLKDWSEAGSEAHHLSGEEVDTNSDLMLAKMLQMQYDRECDTQLRRAELKYNGDSKVSISFENYRMVHPCEDSSSSEDEVDWQDTQDDPYKAYKPQATPRKGFTGKGKNITTKHDEVLCGRKNTARMDNVRPPHPTVDPRTRLLMYKMVSSGTLESINGCISTGKESVVFHANGGMLEEKPVPDEVVLKVFKTTLNEFRNRDRYIKDDYRFKDRFSKLNPRKIIQLWAEKEKHNLTRMKKAGIPCPDVALLRKHILVLTFIGKDHIPAPKLKDVMLSTADMKTAYYQVLQVWLIDVSQSVEPNHPNGLMFLFRDCTNVATFFQKRGVAEAMSVYELFNCVTGLDLAITEDDEGKFIAQIMALEKRNEDHVQKRGRKTFPVSSCDGSPPLKHDFDD
ncbi:hypothetical protein CRUP_021905 [Coryphaenoides rupestris]|nr:hypothetical protein CRUP_021905 [Coryphaenoides rupestris]